MPLINLSTDLTSLRYGGDRPGGGSSGQPYIVSPPRDNIATFPLAPGPFLEFYSLNRNTRDYPIRGGAIQSTDRGLFTTPAAAIDRDRISRFLNDPQRGSIFLLKQAGLQLSNPRIQVPGALLPLEIGSITGSLEETRYYDPNGQTTLQQIGVQGTGVHITRHGVGIKFTDSFGVNYEQYVKLNNGEGTNRLAILARAKLDTISPIYNPYVGKSAEYGISILTNEIFNYQGGPGSTYGIGNTVIKRATNTNTERAYATVALTYSSLFNQPTGSYVDRAHPVVRDFRQRINEQTRNATQKLMTASYDDPTAWYSSDLVGNFGQSYAVFSRSNYLSSSNQTDKVNKSGLYTYDAINNQPWTVKADGKPLKDIIKFSFEFISNDKPNEVTATIFRAFLTSMTDSNQGEFNTFKYLGRGETFRTYQGFDRSISFAFKLAVFSRQEQLDVYKKLNHLMTQVYPDYDATTKFMRGTITMLTIGDYLYRVPGYLENVNITADMNGGWEIALEAPDGNSTEISQMPHVVEIQCSFKPIHSFLPRRQTTAIDNTDVPLIMNKPKQKLNTYLDSDGNPT